MSPAFTVNGSFVCVFVTVFPESNSALPFAKAFKLSWDITGSLETLGATPFIDTMNFLNAKSNFALYTFCSSLSLKDFVSFFTIAIGCVTLIWAAGADQYVIVLPVVFPDMLNTTFERLSLTGTEI